MGGAGRAQRGGGGFYARGLALAASRRPARPRRGCRSRPVRNGLFAARTLPAVEGRASRRAGRPELRRRGRARPRADPFEERGGAGDARRPSPTTTRSRRSASSPTCARPAGLILRSPPGWTRSPRTTLSTRRALVHGDVSPKNILVGPDGPVFLDAECAWFGDPAFDLAFCLNHLLLKGARAGRRQGAVSRGLRCARRRLSRGRRLGGAARTRGARRRPAAGAVPRPGRRQVAGRISDPRQRARGGPALRHPADRGAAAKARRRRRRLGRRTMSDPVIQSLRGRRVWDSRGRPTVEAEIALSDGAVGRAIAPAGASRGSREAVEKRDGGPRLGGLDVPRRARRNLDRDRARAHRRRSVRPGRARRALVELDGTDNLSRLGGNALTAVSLAVLHAAAASRRLPLWRHLAGDGPALIPLPEIQIFGGGAHAGRRTDVQDFMIVAPRAASFRRGAGDDGGGLPRRRHKSWPSAASSWASPTRAAGGPRSKTTSRRSRR